MSGWRAAFRRNTRSIQRTSYLVSRASGDAHAAARGPGPLAKRIVRRKVTAAVFRAFR